MATLTDLTVQQPQISPPLATLGQIANLRAASIENLLRQQQIQQATVQTQNLQAEAATHQQAVKDQNVAQEAFKDPATVHAITSWDGKSAFPLDGKVSPAYADTLKKAVQTSQQAAAVLTDKQRTENDNKIAKVGATIEGLSGLSDEDLVARAPDAISSLVESGDLDPQKAAKIQIRSRDDLNALASQFQAMKGLHDYTQKQAETQATINERNQQAADAVSRKSETDARAKQAMRSNDAHDLLMATTPESYASVYSQLPPDRQSGFPSQFNAANPKETETALLKAGMTTHEIAQMEDTKKSNPNELSMWLKVAGGDEKKALALQEASKIRVAATEAKARADATNPPLLPGNSQSIPISSITGKPKVSVTNRNGNILYLDTQEQADAYNAEKNAVKK